MAEQNPAINAVTYIISTLKANNVNAQDIESGIEIPIKVLLLALAGNRICCIFCN